MLGAVGELFLEGLLAFHQALAQILEINAGLLGLGEQAFRALFLLLDVVLDHLRQDADLGIVELCVGRAVEQLGDQHLGAIMLDIGLLEQLLDLAMVFLEDGDRVGLLLGRHGGAPWRRLAMTGKRRMTASVPGNREMKPNRLSAGPKKNGAFLRRRRLVRSWTEKS